jgi:integrase
MLYGSGLRLMEALRPRLQDVEIGVRQVTVRSGKGDKDRVTVFPASLVEPLQKHLLVVRRCTEPTWRQTGGEWCCRWHWGGNTRTTPRNGAGSTSSHSLTVDVTPGPERKAGTTLIQP